MAQSAGTSGVRRRAALLPALAAVALAAVALGQACGTGSDRLTVFAAASLSDVLGGDDEAGDGVRYSFAGSQQLAAQLEGGAEADVVVTADQRTIERVADEYRPVATTSLAIAVEPGNPHDITALADLARVTVVLAHPAVPIGGYAVEALRRANVTVDPRSLELDVEAALHKVATGEADATIAYAVSKGTLVAIPPEHNVAVRFYAAAFTDRGAAFVRRLPAHLQQHGFGPP